MRCWMFAIVLGLAMAAPPGHTDSAGRTLVIGDSLTYGLFLHGAFPSNFVQLAAGGATTGYAADRLAGAIDFYNGPIFHPQLENYIVFLGANDYYAGVDLVTFENGFRTIVSFMDPPTKLYCVGLTPMPELPDRQPQILYAKIQHRVCEEYGGTHISPHAVLTLKGQPIPGYFASDKLHLSFEGSKKLGHYIQEIVDAPSATAP